MGESEKRPFEGRPLVIGTMHGKELVIGPIMDAALGVNSFASTDFDTDQWGTFSGEVERPFDPISTVRAKCLAAMELHGVDMGVASEGSFGPHPTMFFVPGDEELIMFIDRRNGLEVLHREVSTETNFAGTEIDSEDALREFAEKAMFPSHALVLREARTSTGNMVKGITDWASLRSHFNDILFTSGRAYVETDMRAMHNPSRMRVIEKCTEALVEKILSFCPACGSPGFVVTETIGGLPCGLCHTPTRSIRSLIRSCALCGLRKEEPHPTGKEVEDPMFCDQCNP